MLFRSEGAISSEDSDDGSFSGIELVLTGRDAPQFMTEAADYITEMKKIKHPYDKGVNARIGIEY